MPMYQVTVFYEYTTEVEADDEFEAEEAAISEASSLGDLFQSHCETFEMDEEDEDGEESPEDLVAAV